MTTSEDALTLGDILDDLTLIASTIIECAASEGDASYESIQQRLSQNLKLHLLSYVRFLENHGYLIYNRISDSMELTEEGRQAMQAPAIWSGQAESAFSEDLRTSGESDILDPDAMTNVVDIDSIGADFLAQFDAVTGGGSEASEVSEINDTGRLADIAMGIDDLISEVSEAEEQEMSEASSLEAASEVDEPGAVPLGREESSLVEEVPAGAQPVADEPFVSPEPPAPEPAAPAVPAAASPAPSPAPVRAAPAPAPAPAPVRATPAMAAPAPKPKPAVKTPLSRPHASSLAPKNKERTMDDGYERIDEIGSGGIGTVYRARQVRLNRDVAVKEVREIFNVFADVQRDDIIARFTEIIQTHAALLHPNIVQIVDVETDSEYPFVVMQYAPKGNLRRLIDVDDRPPLGVALKYFLQILHALNAAHDKGIVHGSIKPENVVLDASGNAMLTDFGISRVVERDAGRGNQVYVGVGTVAYMSPEQFQDPNRANVKSDIYSLGIMLYEMLTGKVPGRRSPMPSSFYPDIPRKLDDIFDCMSMDREEDRYDSIDEIIAELYGSSDVMKILDKRSGVLFLRDPLDHGEVGLVHAEAPEFVTSIAEFANSEHTYEGRGEDLELDHGTDEKADAGLDEGSSEVDEEAGAEASEAGSEEGQGDVLDKLNKYGELFEED